MNSSDLNKLFTGGSSGEHLQKIIKDEVSEYEVLMKKKGSTIPLKFHEDQKIFLNNSSLTKLLSETLVGRLSNIDLAYICDCLTLGEEVYYENEKISDIIFQIADPEINNGYKSNPEIKNFISDLPSGS